MAMKKKFLGLAMAAAVALPASSAYAAGTTGTQTINSDNSNVQVEVTGEVLNKDGQKPQKMEVVLPSKMAFTVDATGDLQGTQFEIANNSTNVDINVSVAEFTGGRTLTNGSGEGIEVVDEDRFSDGTGFYRNQVKLSLGKVGSNDPLDLGTLRKSPSTVERKVATIDSGQKATLELKGKAGSESVSSKNATDVDTKGATDDFKLVFSISKK